VTKRANDWCILRTSGPRTLMLAASLQGAGVQAWTPTEHRKRRVPRGKAVEHQMVAMTPTYVFVRECHLPDLRRLEKQHGSPHPSFSIFRYYGATVFVRHGSLHGLRQLQQNSYLASLPNAPRHAKKARAEHYDIGDVVKLKSGAFAGFEAMVETSDGLTTSVRLTLFGRDAGVKIATSQMRADDVTVLRTAA
jgi:transcription antitermination factor NusG